MVVGHVDGTDTSDADALTVTFSAAGAVLNTTVYGGTGEERYKEIVRAPDGSLVAVGRTSSPVVDGFGTTYGNADMLVTKFTSDGSSVT